MKEQQHQQQQRSPAGPKAAAAGLSAPGPERTSLPFSLCLPSSAGPGSWSRSERPVSEA